jgi:putative metallohydrolase (TIGR04338 family)
MQNFILFLILFQDPQKPGVYKADESLIYSPECVVMEFQDIPSYVDRVYNDPWFKSRYPRANKPVVIKSDLVDVAYSTGNKIAFPQKVTNVAILHEISHQLTGNNGHGPNFSRHYVDLVWRFMGLKSANMLRDLYIDLHVNWLAKPNGQ